MSAKNDYLKAMHAKLALWESEFELLKARTGQSAGAARARAEEELKKLADRADEARRRLDDLRSKSEDSWADLRNDLNVFWTEVQNRTKAAKDALLTPAER